MKHFLYHKIDLTNLPNKIKTSSHVVSTEVSVKFKTELIAISQFRSRLLIEFITSCFQKPHTMFSSSSFFPPLLIQDFPQFSVSTLGCRAYSLVEHGPDNVTSLVHTPQYFVIFLHCQELLR